MSDEARLGYALLSRTHFESVRTSYIKVHDQYAHRISKFMIKRSSYTNIQFVISNGINLIDTVRLLNWASDSAPPPNPAIGRIREARVQRACSRGKLNALMFHSVFPLGRNSPDL